MDKFYIYQHRRNDTGEVFYVGKGQGRRAHYKHSRGKHWHSIVNKAGFTVEIIEDKLFEGVAFEKEVCLIKSIGRKDLGEIFTTVKAAARACGLSHGGHISSCLTGKRKTAGGRTWKYYTGGNNE